MSKAKPRLAGLNHIALEVGDVDEALSFYGQNLLFRVTVTCLMPGATETEFFRRADMLDTKVGTDKKDDPAMSQGSGSRQ